MNGQELEQLDTSTREEYKEALRIAPRLVSTETNFVKFLLVENLDPARAARRIALYWKRRKALFTQRWLLPMDQVLCGTYTWRFWRS